MAHAEISRHELLRSLLVHLMGAVPANMGSPKRIHVARFLRNWRCFFFFLWWPLNRWSCWRFSLLASFTAPGTVRPGTYGGQGAEHRPQANCHAASTSRDQRLPRRSCSRSIASNSALKLPLPKPSEPCRSISSKNTVGRSPTGLVKICSR